MCQAVLVTHFLTRFHFGMGWVFIILAFCNTYYSTSMVRTRRKARDDIQRELVKTRLSGENEVESADWLNNFLDRFWLIYEPVLSRTIVASVDQILSQSCPPFLESLRLSTFTLGTKAPRIEKVKTFPRTEDDVVLMEWWLSFTPNDVSELTDKQKLNKVNPKVILSVRLGKGLASAGMPILVEDMTFKGHMKIRMKLMTNFPHVQLVDVSFMEKPIIDYVLKPIGGETFGFDIANVSESVPFRVHAVDVRMFQIPGLSSFIRETVHSILGPMMYEPNVFTLNLEQMLSGAPIDTAIGVLQVTIQGARDIQTTKFGGGRPDPYVTLSINERAELAKTKWKHNTYVIAPLCGCVTYGGMMSSPVLIVPLGVCAQVEPDMDGDQVYPRQLADGEPAVEGLGLQRAPDEHGPRVRVLRPQQARGGCHPGELGAVDSEGRQASRHHPLRCELLPCLEA